MTWTGTFITNLILPIGEAMVFNASVDVLYEDELNERTSQNFQDSYTRINARLALVSTEQTWSVALIGKNLTDETTFGNGRECPSSRVRGSRTERLRALSLCSWDIASDLAAFNPRIDWHLGSYGL